VRRDGRVRLAVVTMLFLLCALGAPSAAQQEQPIPEPAARIVVLADESESVTTEAVEQEQRAVALLAVSELSEQSEMAVLGYGSANGQGQNAVEPYCGFTPLDTPENRQGLADCGTKIHKREPAEGDDTNLVAALQAARELFSQPAGSEDNRSRIILLLSGSTLDVPNSSQDGPSAEQQAEAARPLLGELQLARQNNVQIWPIVFAEGEKTRVNYAQEGAMGTEQCGAENIPVPVFRRAPVPDMTHFVVRALGEATCSSVANVAAVDSVPLGATRTLEVEIPHFASEGVISVIKGDPKVRVTYRDPEDMPAESSSVVQVGLAEGLLLRDPKPGTWRVVFEAPSGVTPGRVTARAIWRRVVQSEVRLAPSLTGPANAVEAYVLLRAPSGVLTDPGAQGLTITAIASRDGSEPILVNLNDTLRGQFLLPDGPPPNFTVEAHVKGKGVAAVERVASVSPTDPFLSVQVTLPETVVPGETAEGTIDFFNPRVPVSANLALTNPSAGIQSAGIQIEPATITFPTGRDSLRFRFTVAPDVPPRQSAGVLNVTAGDGRQLAQVPLNTTIERSTSFQPLPWLAALVGIALAVVGVRTWWSDRKSMKDVLFILRDGTGAELDFERVGAHCTKLSLGISTANDDDLTRLQLLRKSADGKDMSDVLTVTRKGNKFLVKGDKARAQRIKPGKPPYDSVEVSDDLKVQIHDPRVGRPTAPPPATRVPTAR